MKLCDQTGKIAMHVGTIQTTTKDKDNGIENLLDWKDCLIQVNKFDVVVESLRSCLLQTISGEKRTRIYIRTSLDCIKLLLQKKTAADEATAQETGPEGDKKSNTKSSIQEQKQVSNTELLNKDKGASNPCIAKAAVITGASESRDKSVTCEEHLSTCAFTCKLLFLVRHRENLQLKKKRRVMYACAVDVKVVAYSTNEMQLSDNDVPRMLVKNKSLILRLQSEAVIFHPFLQDGAFYLLTESAVDKGNSVAMRALNRNVRSVLNVTSSMDITLAHVTEDGVTEECDVTMETSDVLKAMDDAREKFRCDEEDKLHSVEEVLSTAGNQSSDKG